MEKLFLSQVIKNLQKQMNFLIKIKNVSCKVWNRSKVINLTHLFRHFEIHTGKNFYGILVTSDYIGKPFGSFSFTRKKALHVIINKNKKKKK